MTIVAKGWRRGQVRMVEREGTSELKRIKLKASKNTSENPLRIRVETEYF
jgi:hypothetical protein